MRTHKALPSQALADYLYILKQDFRSLNRPVAGMRRKATAAVDDPNYGQYRSYLQALDPLRKLSMTFSDDAYAAMRTPERIKALYQIVQLTNRAYQLGRYVMASMRYYFDNAPVQQVLKRIAENAAGAYQVSRMADVGNEKAAEDVHFLEMRHAEAWRTLWIAGSDERHPQRDRFQQAMRAWGQHSKKLNNLIDQVKRMMGKGIRDVTLMQAMTKLSLALAASLAPYSDLEGVKELADGYRVAAGRLQSSMR